MIKILECDKVSEKEIFNRNETVSSVEDIVRDIILNVRTNGDKALFEYGKKFDKTNLQTLLVSADEINEAEKVVDDKFKKVLALAVKNITEFHKKQAREGFEIESDGKILGQKITPISKVALYVPGGTATYPSTVLMNAIPAKIAGCKEIVIATPPNSEGKINANILVAAKMVGVDKIYKMGGAQAVAALTYGTESVGKVDKIVGPGNAFVAEAKRQVFGKVAIDMIAGPSEILVVADKNNNARHIAADLLSQAEHDKMASAVLVTDSRELAVNVQRELEIQIPKLLRCEIARASIDNNGKIIVADSLEKVIDIANEIAPEHLELMVEEPFKYLDKIVNAGSVFLGKNCPEALGDYLAGSNHTLPTSGTAKFSSPLSVDDFIKKTQYIYYSEEAIKEVAESVAYFAEKEGLTAHAKSATIRLENNNE